MLETVGASFAFTEGTLVGGLECLRDNLIGIVDLAEMAFIIGEIVLLILTEGAAAEKWGAKIVKHLAKQEANTYL